MYYVRTILTTPRRWTGGGVDSTNKTDQSQLIILCHVTLTSYIYWSINVVSLSLASFLSSSKVTHTNTSKVSLLKNLAIPEWLLSVYIIHFWHFLKKKRIFFELSKFEPRMS